MFDFSCANLVKEVLFDLPEQWFIPEQLYDRMK
jgi:hypothetical protein